VFWRERGVCGGQLGSQNPKPVLRRRGVKGNRKISDSPERVSEEGRVSKDPEEEVGL